MSLILDFKRIFKTGFVGLKRNTLVSVASVVMTTITLLLIGLLMLSGAVLDHVVDAVEAKVDVNVYLLPSASEDKIVALQQSIMEIPEVAEVTYITKEQALSDFKERHASDQLIQQSLEELGSNPLGGVLNIRAINPESYEAISGFLESKEKLSSLQLDGIIEQVNFNRNKEVIEQLTELIKTIRLIGFWISAFFLFISILIMHTTIRLGIFAAKEEISIMRLVGAENKFIRGPFLVQGLMTALIGAILTMIVLYFGVGYLNNDLALYFNGFEAFAYLQAHMLQLGALLLAVGVIAAFLSSVIAMRRYLKK